MSSTYLTIAMWFLTSEISCSFSRLFFAMSTVPLRTEARTYKQMHNVDAIGSWISNVRHTRGILALPSTSMHTKAFSRISTRCWPHAFWLQYGQLV